jgi:hypothetical protein
VISTRSRAPAASCSATGGTLTIGDGSTTTTLQGIELLADTVASDLPAVDVLAPTSSGRSVVVESCTFVGLRGARSPAAGGAALSISGSSARISVEVRGSRFVDCSAGGPGGAIFASNGVDLLVQSSSFERNEARYAGSTAYGGSIAVFASSSGASLTLLDCSLLDSVSWGPGGAVYVQDGALVMRDTEVRGSRSAFGGITNWGAGAGVFLRRAGDDPEPVTLIAERCDFVDNRADLSLGVGGADGGGLMIRGSDSFSPVVATILDCRFERNFSDQGAGLYVGRGVSATIERSYFLDNTAHSNGGGAYKGGEFSGNIGETALFSYCVFARNRAGWDQNDQPIGLGGFGGAFMVRLNPRAEFHNCTFVDNLSGPNGQRGDAIFLWNEGKAITHVGQRSRIVNWPLLWSHGQRRAGARGVPGAHRARAQRVGAGRGDRGRHPDARQDRVHGIALRRRRRLATRRCLGVHRCGFDGGELLHGHRRHAGAHRCGAGDRGLRASDRGRDPARQPGNEAARHPPEPRQPARDRRLHARSRRPGTARRVRSLRSQGSPHSSTSTFALVSTA